MLAVILADASEELDKLTHDFAPREPGETPSDFAKRMVGSAAAVYANNDPVMQRARWPGTPTRRSAR